MTTLRYSKVTVRLESFLQKTQKMDTMKFVLSKKILKFIVLILTS